MCVKHITHSICRASSFHSASRFFVFLPAVSRTLKLKTGIPDFYNFSIWWTEVVTSAFPRYSCRTDVKTGIPISLFHYQIWQTSRSRGVDINETNEAGACDITSRSRDKLKSIYLNYLDDCGLQIWQDFHELWVASAHNVILSMEI